jgi:hypothetical protein
MIYRNLSLRLILIAIVVFFMMPITVMAGGDAAGESTQAVLGENSVEGTLTMIESYGHILIRPEIGNLAKLKVRPKAVIMRNGKRVRLGELRVGDKVRANYDSKNWVFELHATGT